MAFVFTVIFGAALACLITLGIKLRRTTGEVTPRIKAQRVGLALSAVSIAVLLYKVAVEEVYPCLFVDNRYCDFTATAYHSSWFPF